MQRGAVTDLHRAVLVRSSTKAHNPMTLPFDLPLSFMCMAAALCLLMDLNPPQLNVSTVSARVCLLAPLVAARPRQPQPPRLWPLPPATVKFDLVTTAARRASLSVNSVVLLLLMWHRVGDLDTTSSSLATSCGARSAVGMPLIAVLVLPQAVRVRREGSTSHDFDACGRDFIRYLGNLSCCDRLDCERGSGTTRRTLSSS
jgi:hypothetical protein